MVANPGEGFHRAAEAIDRLLTVDVTNRGVIRGLYDAARSEQRDESLSGRAAKAIAQDTGPGDVVLIATGWPDRPWISEEIAELDGPPGAIVLARAVHVAFDAVPVIICEEQLRPQLKAGLRGAGLYADLSIDQAIDCTDSDAEIHGAAVVPLSTDIDSARDETETLVNEYDVTAAISIEKGGMNDQGAIHNMSGTSTTETMAKADAMMEVALDQGIPTIGIGDGGNEIGMGVIADYVRDNLPYGEECACDCGGGLAPTTETDVLVTACISNWGGYGVAAALAALEQDPDVLHSPELEERILRECADAGLIDGVSGWTIPGSDGLPSNSNLSCVNLLNDIIDSSLDEGIQA